MVTRINQAKWAVVVPLTPKRAYHFMDSNQKRVQLEINLCWEIHKTTTAITPALIAKHVEIHGQKCNPFRIFSPKYSTCRCRLQQMCQMCKDFPGSQYSKIFNRCSSTCVYSICQNTHCAGGIPTLCPTPAEQKGLIRLGDPLVPSTHGSKPSISKQICFKAVPKSYLVTS